MKFKSELPCSWLQYKLNTSNYGEFKESDFINLNSYNIMLPAPANINPDYKNELYKTIKNLPENTKYYLLFSGGYDSAVSFYSFIDCGVPFIPVVGKFVFKDDIINLPELEHAYADLKKANIPSIEVEIDVYSFLKKRKFLDWYSRFPNWHIERYLQMELIQSIPRDGTLIISAGDPNLVLDNGEWHWIDRSCALHHFFQSEDLNLPMIVHFLTCTSNLGASFLLNQHLIELIDKSKHTNFDFGIKYDLYPSLFPNVPFREKIITTNKSKNEEFLKMRDEANLHLRKDKRSYGLEIKIPYADIKNGSWNKEYFC